MKEIYKNVVGLEGKYKVSNFGNIKSLTRNVRHSLGGLKKHKGRIMKLQPQAGGYFQVILSGSTVGKLIHRIVAQAFIPNPQNKPCVNHKDGNKANNNVSNLEWVTYSENQLHSFRVLGTKASRSCYKKGNIPFNARKVMVLNKNGKKISVHKSIRKTALKYNVSDSFIKRRCHNEVKNIGRYNFVFA